MDILRRERGVHGIIILLKLFNSARCAPRDSAEWSLTKSIEPKEKHVLSEYWYNGSYLASDIELVPGEHDPTLPPSDEFFRYKPNKRICEDLFPPKDNTTTADGTKKFDYEVIADWYSKWHLNIGFHPKKRQDIDHFKGILVQVRHKGVVVGSYDEAPEYSLIDCPPGKQNTPYYGSIDDTTFKFVTWKPPKDFDSKGIYVIHSTMMVEPGQIYRKTTNIPVWESLPKGYNISNPNLNSETFKVDRLPWDDPFGRLNDYAIPGLMG